MIEICNKDTDDYLYYERLYDPSVNGFIKFIEITLVDGDIHRPTAEIHFLNKAIFIVEDWNNAKERNKFINCINAETVIIDERASMIKR